MVNEELLRVTNSTKAMLLGHTRDVILSKEVVAQHEANDQQVMTEMKSSVFEETNSQADGPHHYLSTKFPLLDVHGKCYAVGGISLDVTERKRAEVALKESLGKFQMIVETTGDFIWEMDLRGAYIYCSPQMKILWGLDPKEMLGRTPLDMMPSEDREQAQKVFDAAFKSPGPIKNLEVRSLDGAGRIRFLEVNGVPFLDAKGKPVGYWGITRDITERKMAEATIRSKEKNLADLFESVDEAIYFLTVEAEGKFRFQAANPAFFRTTGSTASQVIGKLVNEVMSEPSLTLALANYRLAIQNRETVRWEETTSHLFGIKIVEIGISPIFDGQDACTGLIGTVYDITERRMITSALAASELKYRTLIESATDQIFMLDDKYRFLTLNKAAAASLGKSSSEVIGKPLTKFFPKEQAAQLLKNIVGVFKTGQAATDLEEKIDFAGGIETFNSTALTPVKDERGIVVAVLGVVRDITERKRVQKIEAIAKLKDDFLFKTIHDLRSPTAIIKMVQDSLSRSAPVENPQAVESYGLIGVASKRLSGLIEDLLKIGQEADPNFKLVLKPTALRGVMNAVLAELAPKAAAKRVSVEHATAPADLSEILGNEDALKEVFVNLVDDAIKYNKEGGRVTVGYEVVGRTVQVSVRDTGKGIADQYLSKLFTPYYRADIGRDTEGTGLGLYIVKNLVEKMNGTVAVSSIAGQGTHFTVSLPLA